MMGLYLMIVYIYINGWLRLFKTTRFMNKLGRESMAKFIEELMEGTEKKLQLKLSMLGDLRIIPNWKNALSTK